MEKARNFTKKIFKLLMKPEMRILPGHLAFFLVMTLIPLVALIATIAANLSISTDSIRVAINSSVPSGIANILNGIMAGDGINFNIIVFYASAFLLASNGAYSMINSSNEIYKVEPNNIVSRRLKAITMTFVLVGIFIFLIIVPIFGSNIFDILKELTGNSVIIQIIREMLVILKYPLILVILFMNIKLMYVIAPDKEIPGKTTNKGALFTTIGWVLSTEVFAFYVEKFARYDLFYGSISNILILLLWIYLLSYIYVLGMVINASEYNGELND
ncbi:MAG: YihY/virulence factor BrkB family protein [Bacilli bacterium]|nr:YihY/virulence factor BrkB family protein [Bacilli bacterium]